MEGAVPVMAMTNEAHHEGEPMTSARDRYHVGLKHLATGSTVDMFEVDGAGPDEVRSAIAAELERRNLVEPGTAVVTVYRPDDFDTGICVDVAVGGVTVLRGAGELASSTDAN